MSIGKFSEVVNFSDTFDHTVPDPNPSQNQKINS